MKLFNAILIVYSLLIGSVFGATITDDTVKIGKPGSSANKEITLGTSKKIRANESTGKLEFSNDGVLYKNLGSGSGSGGSTGTNLIINDSFEDGIGSPWTSSGGTFTQETYAVGFEGNTKYARFVASGAGQYVEQIVSVPTSFSGGCQADFKKVSVSTAGLFKVQALDASDNVLAEQTIGVSSWAKVPTFGFPCPTSGTNNLKLRMISISAGTIDFDLGYIGSNQNIVNVSQPSEWALFKRQTDYVAPAATWYTVPINETSDSTNYPISSSCFSLKVTGKYRLRLAGDFSANGELINFGYQINSGTRVQNSTSHIMDTNGSGSWSRFEDTFSIQGNRGDVVCPQAYITSSRTTKNYEVELHQVNVNPLEQAVSPEQSSWFIDANIGGANANLGTSNLSSYTEVADGGLDLVVNTAKGSAAAEIPCSAGTNSTGATCSGVFEHVGVAFVPPSAGLYEACFAFGHLVNTAANGAAYVTFQLAETPNNSLTILQEGGDRVESGLLSSVGIDARYPRRVCGTFSFSDSSKKTIRLMREQLLAGAVGQNLISAYRLSTVGQYDIHVTVRPLLSAYNRPILTGDQVTRPNSSNIVEYDFIVDSAGGVVNLYGGNLVSSCTNASPNVCTFNAGKFTGQVECYVNIKTAGTYSGQAHTTSASGTSISAWNSTTGASVNNISSKSVRCVGQKPN